MANTTKLTPVSIESRIQTATAGLSLEELLTMVDESTILDTDVIAAQRVLAARGVDVSALPSPVVQSVYTVTTALDSKEEANVKIANVLGTIKASGAFKSWKAPDGKNFKDFKDFCTAMFPDYSYKSLALYADVGTYIYVPIAAGMASYKNFAPLAAFTPSKLKNLVAVFKDSDRLAKLPAALPDAEKIQSMTQKELEKAAAATKAAADGRHSTDKLEDEDARRRLLEFSKMFLFGKTDEGELECLIPDVKVAKKSLDIVASSPDAAVAFVKWLASNLR